MECVCNGLFISFLAPSKIGCTFPRWMQEKKSWATIDGALLWKFATSGNSTWMNMTTVTSNNFGLGISSYVKHEESLVWCHKIISDNTLSTSTSTYSQETSANHRAKIILYQTQGWSVFYSTTRGKSLLELWVTAFLPD